ncbi:helix-turn-helix transcriptional regulator [Candidatus Saccharibacteria bacterium]|nr:helix-turn-helix transcriptional regulator [Candidatus Saccharibacteria bacterium]
MLDIKEVEKIAKGLANHNRIKILLALDKEPDMTLFDIAGEIKTGFRNVSEHSRKLVAGGLITKKYRGQAVEHRLTQRGKEALRFCKVIK